MVFDITFLALWSDVCSSCGPRNCPLGLSFRGVCHWTSVPFPLCHHLATGYSDPLVTRSLQLCFSESHTSLLTSLFTRTLANSLHFGEASSNTMVFNSLTTKVYFMQTFIHIRKPGNQGSQICWECTGGKMYNLDTNLLTQNPRPSLCSARLRLGGMKVETP